MASRFDQPSEPDFDRYDSKPFDPQDDLDIPDFDQPEPIIDPADHAAQDVTGALLTLEQQIAGTTDLERVMVLRKMVKTLVTHVLAVSDRAAAKCDELLERRR